MSREITALDKYREYENASATPDEVDSLEAELGVHLPADYRNFLLLSNGGDYRGLRVATPWHPVSGDELQCLLGTGNGVDGDEFLGDEGDIDLFDNNRPIRLLPIGKTQLGHFLLMDFSEDNHGSIWIKKSFDSEGFVQLHSRFSDFLTTLVSQSQED